MRVGRTLRELLQFFEGEEGAERKVRPEFSNAAKRLRTNSVAGGRNLPKF